MSFPLLSKVPPLSLEGLQNSPTTAVIPLYLAPDYQTKDGDKVFCGYKVGINVVLTQSVPQTIDGKTVNVPVSSDPCLYEFDTGGKGFWAQPINNNMTVIGTTTITTQYTSGIQYTASPQAFTVSFPGSTPSVSVDDVTVALITESTKDGSSYPIPIYQYFYGDFGVSLQPTSTDPSILTILSQLDSPYGNGFIVYLEEYPKEPPQEPTLWGYLFVGLTDEIRDCFNYTTSMNQPSETTWSSSGGASINVYSEALVNGVAEVGGSNPTDSIGVIFDTGTPGTVLYEGSQYPTNFNDPKSGSTFTLTVDMNIDGATSSSAVNIMDFASIGSRPGYNEVSLSDKKEQTGTDFLGTCNTGLAPYFGNMIMYDIENGKIGLLALDAPANN